MSRLLDVLHQIVESGRWRSEAELLNAHEVLTEDGPAVFDVPAAGVQKPSDSVSTNADTSNPDAAPFGGTDPAKDTK